MHAITEVTINLKELEQKLVNFSKFQHWNKYCT